MVRDRVVDSSLTIYSVTLNDAGKYICTATTHDKKTSAASIDIHVYSTHSYINVFLVLINKITQAALLNGS